MARSSSRTKRSGSASRTSTTGASRSSDARGAGTARSTKSGRPLKKNGKRKLVNYPRAGKGKLHRWIPSWRFVVGSFLTGTALVCGVVIAAYAGIEVKDPSEITLPEKSTLYYADGTEMTSFYDQERVIVEAGDIPLVVRHAVVAAEDKTFYENSGIDPKGLARAAIGNVKYLVTGDGRVTGGSTITQQYVERFYVQSTTTGLAGKFEEMLTAVKVGQSQDKDEILTNYLNTIYFGRGANGIEVAAQKYFGKSAKDLTVAEAALIAGIIPSPGNWDPRVSEASAKKAEERWNYVLNNMVEKGWLSAADRAALVFPTTIEVDKTANRMAGPQGYLIDMTLKELDSQLGITREMLDQGGYSIKTTIDKNMQSDLLWSMQNEMPGGASPDLKVAVVTMDPTTGGYLALYGGPDYLTGYNTATYGQAQAGSTFKPLTLMAALEDGKTLNDVYDGNGPKYFGKTRVDNFGLASYGPVTLEKATQDSINTAYVELNEEIGPQATVDAAVAAGIPDGKVEPVLSNVLGTATIHPVDLASAYTTLASGGIKRTPHIVKSATKAIPKSDDVEVLFEESTAGDEQVFSPENTAEVTYAMTQVVQKGSGKTAKELGIPVAGKTGTSQENKSAWFAGFTPNLVTVVSLYQDGINPETGKVEQQKIEPFGGYNNGITGSTVPADIWTNYMKVAVKHRPEAQFPARTAKAASVPVVTPTEEPTEEPTVEAPTTVVVPDGLLGVDQATAGASISAVGLHPSFSESYNPAAAGTVIAVNPGSGQTVDVGTTVAVTVSKGPEPKDPKPTAPPTTKPTTDPTTPPTKEPTAPPTTEPTTPTPPDPGDEGKEDKDGKGK